MIIAQGCAREAHVDKDFLDTNNIVLWVKGSAVHTYDPLTWQLSCNRSKYEFRVSNDTMSEYYVLTCDKMPLEMDQEVIGNLTWTTTSSTASAKNLTFKVVKTDSNGNIWLWNGKEKIGVSVRSVR